MTIPRLLLSLLLSVAAVPALASGTSVPEGWSVLRLPGKQVAHFTAGPDGAITVAAQDSVGFLYRDASTVAGAGRYLAWRWRVDAAPPPTNLAMKGMDDRPLAVHVWFMGPESRGGHWSFGERLGAWLLGAPLPGRTLTYVWGGAAQRGDHLRNPYLEANGQIIVLRPGTSPTGTWFEETVDIAADFEAAFGDRPVAPAYVVISADTDDKGGASEGIVADIAFKDEP